MIKGICSEDGGMLCTAAFIARELGIPAVVGVTANPSSDSTVPASASVDPASSSTSQNVIQNIQNGDYIQIDGYVGIVKLLSMT